MKKIKAYKAGDHYFKDFYYAELYTKIFPILRDYLTEVEVVEDDKGNLFELKKVGTAEDKWVKEYFDLMEKIIGKLSPRENAFLQNLSIPGLSSIIKNTENNE